MAANARVATAKQHPHATARLSTCLSGDEPVGGTDFSCLRAATTTVLTTMLFQLNLNLSP